MLIQSGHKVKTINQNVKCRQFTTQTNKKDICNIIFCINCKIRSFV